MSFFDKLFGKQKKTHPAVEHAVIVYFKYGTSDLSRLYTLEDKLEQVIRASGVGEYDGHEVAVDGSDGTLYMYGPDADALIAVVLPVLKGSGYMNGARIVLRYGPPQADVKTKEMIVNG
jgi:hypothetical protein